MEEKRKPDTELAKAIRSLEVILNVLRENYDSSKIDHHEYLKTEAWQERRFNTFKRDGFQCVCCGAAKNLEAHHITYKNLGAELQSDLVTLCRKCHEDIHSGDLEPTKEMKRKGYERHGSRKPQDLTFDEAKLLRYATLCREREIEIEDDYLFNPIWFQTQYGREQAEQFNAGGYMDKVLEDYINRDTSCRSEFGIEEDDVIVKAMYFAFLFKVYDVWATHWEKNYIDEVRLVNEERKKEIRKEWILIDKKRKQLRNAAGDL